MKRNFDLAEYFKTLRPKDRNSTMPFVLLSLKLKHAIRAIVLEKQSVEMVAKKYNYKHSTIYALLRDAKARKIELFPVVQKGPQQKRTPSDVQKIIIS